MNPDEASLVNTGSRTVLIDDDENGRFRTSILRNVTITAPYIHNGVFDSLEEVVSFYKPHNVDRIVPETIDNPDNSGNIGNLNLTDGEIEPFGYKGIMYTLHVD